MISFQPFISLLLQLIAVTIAFFSLFFSYLKDEVRFVSSFQARQKILIKLTHYNKQMDDFINDLWNSVPSSAYYIGLAFGAGLYILMLVETIVYGLNTLNVFLMVFTASILSAVYLPLVIKEQITKHGKGQKSKWFYHLLRLVYSSSILWFTLVLFRMLWDVLLYSIFQTNAYLGNLEISLFVTVVAFSVAVFIKSISNSSIAERDQFFFSDYLGRSGALIFIRIFTTVSHVEGGTALIEGSLLEIGKQLTLIDSAGYHYQIEWTKVHLLGSR